MTVSLSLSQCESDSTYFMRIDDIFLWHGWHGHDNYRLDEQLYDDQEPNSHENEPLAQQSLSNPRVSAIAKAKGN